MSKLEEDLNVKLESQMSVSVGIMQALKLYRRSRNILMSNIIIATYV